MFESALKDATRALIIQTSYWGDYAKRSVIIEKMLDANSGDPRPTTLREMEAWLTRGIEAKAARFRADYMAGIKEPNWSKELEDPCVMLNRLCEARRRLDGQLTSLRASPRMLLEGKVLASLLGQVEEAVRSVSLDGKLSFTGRARWRIHPLETKSGTCKVCRSFADKIFTSETLPPWPAHPSCVCDLQFLDNQQGGTP
jgi:hypothetical protein